jgi:hypothetical protein
MYVRNHRLRIRDRHIGIDRQFGLKGPGKFVDDKRTD